MFVKKFPTDATRGVIVEKVGQIVSLRAATAGRSDPYIHGSIVEGQAVLLTVGRSSSG
jgi:hypothetical protein